MKISCPTCSAKYSIADEKVQNRLAKIRCRKCGTSIVIDGNVSPANVYAADGAPAAGAEAEAPNAAASTTAASASSALVYTVDMGENDQRPMSTAQLVEAYNNGSVTAETYVWTDGFADWTPLGQVEEIVAALHAAAAAAADEPPHPAIDEASAVGASTHIDEKPWDSGPSSLDTQSAAGPASGGGPDLFGSVTDAGRESEGVSVGMAANPFSGANTGARNESSVLFSLSALTSGTGSSRPSVPAPAASSSTNDDSGLIDLKALTATAAATGGGAPMAAPPVAPAVSPFAGAAPLGAPSPLSAPNMGRASLGPMPAQKNNTGLIIGASIVVAAVAVAAIVTFGGGDEQPVAPPVPAVSAPAAAAPAPAPAPEPAPAPAKEPESDAKPPATGTEEEEAAPSAPKKTYPRPKSSAPASAPKAASPSPAPSPAPAPKPKSSGKCGCKADDLMCLMNCAK